MDEALMTMVSKDLLMPTKAQVEQLINLVNELSEKVKALENPLQPIETVPLPRNVRQVLIFSQQEGFCVAEIHSDGLNVLSGGKWKKKKASHWAYIPKIPDDAEDKT